MHEVVVYGVQLSCYLLIGVAVVRCYWWSRNRAHLWLGAILIAWPWIDSYVTLLLDRAVDEAECGRRPTLFPFSLMVPRGELSIGRWEMSIAQFMGRYYAWTWTLHDILLAIVTLNLARSLRRQDAPENRSQGKAE